MQKRYQWHVVVEDEVNKKELEVIAKNIIENAKKELSFNAIAIAFYDYEEYIGKGYTLGGVDYAPEGDWGKASDVKAGNYKKMDYDFNLREKDWSKQLNQEEVDIYKSWNELFAKKDIGIDLPDEDEVSQETADRFDTTKKEVEDILMKQMTWMFDDN